MIEAYFMLSGRMRRRGYLGYSLLLWGLLVLVSLLGLPLIDHARYPTDAKLVVTGAIGLFWAWAVTALSVKRLHDLDKSGWHCLWLIAGPILILVAIGALRFSIDVGSVGYHASGGLLTIVLIVFLFFAELTLFVAHGTRGPNRFGYPP